MRLPTTPVTTLQRELRDEVRHNSPRGRIIIAVDGRDGAGKSTFAQSFARDAPVESRWVTAPEDAVLVVDGIFLNRPALRGLWHWSVWLDVPTDVAAPRRVFRDFC